MAPLGKLDGIDSDITAQLKELHELLSANYVEDDDASFRFNYSADFLKWALKPPGWEKDWHVGVRVAAKKAANNEAKAKGRLVAFISAVPVRLRVRERLVLPLIPISSLSLHNHLASSPLPKSISSAYIRSYGQSVLHRF